MTPCSNTSEEACVYQAVIKSDAPENTLLCVRIINSILLSRYPRPRETERERERERENRTEKGKWIGNPSCAVCVCVSCKCDTRKSLSSTEPRFRGATGELGDRGWFLAIASRAREFPHNERHCSRLNHALFLSLPLSLFRCGSRAKVLRSEAFQPRSPIVSRLNAREKGKFREKKATLPLCAINFKRSSRMKGPRSDEKWGRFRFVCLCSATTDKKKEKKKKKEKRLVNLHSNLVVRNFLAARFRPIFSFDSLIVVKN